MCFALPHKVASVSNSKIVMEDGRKVDFAMVKSVKKGDWLLVQSNLAVDKLTESQANLMRSAITEVSSGLKN